MMKLKEKIVFLHLPAVFFLVLFMSSCQKESELDIPAYISIDSISLDPNLVTGEQGTISSKIVDAWVYTDDDLEGAFELPARFPVLKAGPTVIHIQPGIKINGMAETRAPYPFYDTISIPVTLTRKNDVEVGHLVTKYKSSAIFGWIEDFEDTHLSLDTSNRNTANLIRVGDPSLSSAFQGEGNQYAGKVELTNDSVYFEYLSHDSFVFSRLLPEEKSYVFLELNYKTNCPFAVGMIIYSDQTKQQPVVVVNKSDTWNKIYINLTPTVSFNTDASKFRIYFSARKEEGGENAVIFLDNIKLLHF